MQTLNGTHASAPKIEHNQNLFTERKKYMHEPQQKVVQPTSDVLQ